MFVSAVLVLSLATGNLQIHSPERQFLPVYLLKGGQVQRRYATSLLVQNSSGEETRASRKHRVSVDESTAHLLGDDSWVIVPSSCARRLRYFRLHSQPAVSGHPSGPDAPERLHGRGAPQRRHQRDGVQQGHVVSGICF